MICFGAMATFCAISLKNNSANAIIKSNVEALVQDVDGEYWWGWDYFDVYVPGGDTYERNVFTSYTTFPDFPEYFCGEEGKHGRTWVAECLALHWIDL